MTNDSMGNATEKRAPAATPARGAKNEDEQLNLLVETSSTTPDNFATPKKALSIAIFILTISQYAYGIFEHSSLMSMQFAASAFAFISALEFFFDRRNNEKSNNQQSVFLLFRTAGTVFYIACLFLNLTHCLEDISDITSSDHAEEDGAENVTVGHSHSSQNELAILGVIDFIIKALFSTFYNALSINIIWNITAFLAPSVFSLILFAYNYNKLNFFFPWLDRHLEPVTSILLTVLCISIAIYSLIRKKHFLLAEGPTNFRIDEISKAVKSQVDSLEKVDHVHASCEWPEGFTVSLKAYIRVEKNNKNWVSRAADDFSNLKTLLHTEIKAQGAKEVIVEPVFIDRNEAPDYSDPICISASCHNEDVGCCTNPKPQEQVQV